MKKNIILVGLCAAAMAVSSCGTFDITSNPYDGETRSPITGRVMRTVDDDGSKAVIDLATIGFWAKFLTKVKDGGLGAAFEGKDREVSLPPGEVAPVKE